MLLRLRPTRGPPGPHDSALFSQSSIRTSPRACGDVPEGFRVYAIVRCGGRQEKVAVDDVLTVDKLAGKVGETVTFPALLVVDGESVVSAAGDLAKYQVTAEILAAVKGPKISILKYKNKTGYKKRQGHRQPYTQVKVTGITA